MTWLAASPNDRDRPWPTPQDYNEAIQNPATSFEDDELRRGAAARNKLGIPKPITGNFATVYQVRTGPSVHAVRCFLRNVPDQRDRYELISRHLADARLRQTVEFSFIERGIRVKGVWYPILKMDWVTGTTLAAFVEEHLDDRRMLNKLAEAFLELLDDLRSHQIAHGDLQHGNLLVVDGRTGPALKLIDYDGMWVPALDGLRSNEVGHPNYQHPHRTGDEYGQTLDSFSAWVIVASLLAVRADPTVWSTVRPKRADDRLLLGKADYLDRDGSQPFRRLRVASDAAAKQAAERLLALCPPSEQVLGLPPPIAEDLSGGRAVQWVPGAPAPVTGEPWWKRARYAKSDAVSAAAVTTAWVAPATGVTTTTGSVAPGAPAGAAQVTTAAGAPAVSSAAAPPRPVTSSPASVAPPPPPAVYAPPQAGPVPVAATGPVPAAWTVASPATSARTSIRKDILLTLLAVGIFAAVVVGAGKWGGVPATAPSMSPMPSPIAAATQAASPVAAAAPTARPTPTPTAAPVTPSPRPTPTPTASPGPNARPAALAFGHLYYTSEGCWSSGWTDSSGTRVDLVRSDIRVTVKNSGQRPSDFLWIEVKSTGPGATHPAYYKTNWSDTGWYVPVDDRAMLLGGPQIQPGETREIAWTSLFETKSDVSYTVTLLPGPDPTLYNDKPGGPTLTKSPIHKPWSLTTTNKPCP